MAGHPNKGYYLLPSRCSQLDYRIENTAVGFENGSNSDAHGFVYSIASNRASFTSIANATSVTALRCFRGQLRYCSPMHLSLFWPGRGSRSVWSMSLRRAAGKCGA